LATAGAAPKGGVYRQTNLVSDIPDVARKTDPNLVDPWGPDEPRWRQIQIDGLWGLIFGDQAAGTANTLFFSAGTGDEAHGLLGTLVPQNGEGH
jgi:hypothetical protein